MILVVAAVAIVDWLLVVAVAVCLFVCVVVTVNV